MEKALKGVLTIITVLMSPSSGGVVLDVFAGSVRHECDNHGGPLVVLCLGDLAGSVVRSPHWLRHRILHFKFICFHAGNRRNPKVVRGHWYHLLSTIIPVVSLASSTPLAGTRSHPCVCARWSGMSDCVADSTFWYIKSDIVPFVQVVLASTACDVLCQCQPRAHADQPPRHSDSHQSTRFTEFRSIQQQQAYSRSTQSSVDVRTLSLEKGCMSCVKSF